MRTIRSTFVLGGGLLFVIFVGTYRLIPVAVPASPPVALAAGPQVSDVVLASAAPAKATYATLARRDPDMLPKLALEHYIKTVHDYTCTFWKQERIGGKLRKVETIGVRYRENPVSVFMTWLRNADQVKRALYVDAPGFVDKHGQKTAKIEPAGAIVRLLVSEVDMPIHGDRARKASRSSMDLFGFRQMLEALLRDDAKAEADGVLDLRYDGESEVDGRPTYVLVRYLPYTGDGSKYPNAKMVMHIDQEWLVPTAVYGYADKEGTQLLCSYVFTDVKINPGLTDADFEF